MAALFDDAGLLVVGSRERSAEFLEIESYGAGGTAVLDVEQVEALQLTLERWLILAKKA